MSKQLADNQLRTITQYTISFGSAVQLSKRKKKFNYKFYADFT